MDVSGNVQLSKKVISAPSTILGANHLIHLIHLRYGVLKISQ